MRLKVRHNAEIAHRLSLSPGKCQQIHGHGLQIELVLLSLYQDAETGMAKNARNELLDFSDVKKRFRRYIDETYDHRLVLNESDVFAGPIFMMTSTHSTDGINYQSKIDEQVFLPGLSLVPGDPTIENLAKWIATWSADAFECDVLCRIDETKTNGAEVMAVHGKKEATVR